jgi:hypothetical protein
MNKVKLYGYLTQRLSLGETVSKVQERALAKFNTDYDTVNLLIEGALRAFAAGAKIMQIDPHEQLPESDIPEVPGPEHGIKATFLVWSNPGECIYAFVRFGAQVVGVSFQQLYDLATAAMAEWKNMGIGNDSPGFAQLVTPGENPITVYRRPCEDVPKGFFRISVERIEREQGPF